MNRLSLLIIFICLALFSNAQDSASVANDITILYRYEASGGITVHSNGLGILFRKGKHITGYKKRMFEAEFVSMRHPKQYKVSSTVVQDGGKPFFFGKLNYVYIPRIGLGLQKIIFGKAEQSGVEVRYNLYGGADLAITKPVYLEVLIFDTPNSNTAFVEEREYDPNDPNQQSPDYIYGPGSYFSGFDQLQLHPGVYGKFSVSFEYGGSQESIGTLEAGVVFDYFPKEIPIMAKIKNDNYFFNFYISILWGKKW